MTTPTYHGIDGNTNPVNDICYDDFYLGEMGMGALVGDTQVYNSEYCVQFNNFGDTGNTESYAQWMVSNGRQNTYGYWFLLGPILANPDTYKSTNPCNGTAVGYRSYAVTNPTDAYNWGVKQADAAFSAWQNDYPSIYRITVFGDIEQAAGSGWYSATSGSNGLVNGYDWYELNKQVIIGFVQEMFNNNLAGGIYSNDTFSQVTNNWTGLGTYTSHVWCANWNGTSYKNCLPTWDVFNIGGVSPQIWQYYSGTVNSSPFDADAAISLPG